MRRNNKMEGFSAVNIGDTFVKLDRVPSQWIVDKVLMSYHPVRVRLIEQGGNGRTSTVALQTLLDKKYWTCLTKKDMPVEKSSS